MSSDVTTAPEPDDPPPGYIRTLAALAGTDVSDTRPAYDRAVKAAQKAAPVEIGFRLTDVGNGQRFAADHRDLVRYCHETKGWLVWDGRRWDRDATGAEERLAKETVRGIYAEASWATNEDHRKRLATWAAKSESRDRVLGMLWAARSEDGIPVQIDQLDADPWALNVRNGTLDLRTGYLRPHRREDLLTKIVPVDFDPTARAPRWASFLEEITDGDQELDSFLHRMIGYSLTASVIEHCLFILWGTGRNGKSVVLSILRALAGDYVRSARSETLLLKRDGDGGAATPGVAKLKGVRVVTATETEDGRRLAEALIKSLTGGDTITARHLYAEEFDFKPEFKIWIASNNKPVVRGTDPAIWARIHLVPFAVSFLGREDRNLTATLVGELPGILAWAVEGCLLWQRDGLNPPACVQAATRAYRAEQDILAQYLDEETERDDCATTTSKALYTHFSAWCKGNNDKPPSKTAVGRRLVELGYAPSRDGRARGWQGLRLKDVAAC